jgi:hypothetical protein
MVRFLQRRGCFVAPSMLTILGYFASAGDRYEHGCGTFGKMAMNIDL